MASMSKILVVEDEQAIADMYKLKLENDGFKVKVAGNGKIGLELSRQWKPDLILLDLMMPVMSGPQMLDKMRATDWGKAIPVIIISNLGMERSDVDTDKYKVSAYIIKALYTPKEIVEEVKKVLKKAR
jgi:two-component system response regulator AdeR